MSSPKYAPNQTNHSSQSPALCEFLSWDSDFFGFKIARVQRDRLNPTLLREVEAWCHENAIRCLYLLASSDCHETARLASLGGFTLVDVRLRLDREIMAPLPPAAPSRHTIREAVPDDVAKLCDIAATAHVTSRFHFDPGFAPARAADLYRVWIQKECGGEADVVWVFESSSEAGGYLSCKLSSDGTICRLGLLGVRSDLRGGGAAPALLKRALEWAHHRGAGRCEVITQGRNIAAQRVYAEVGFKPADMHIWWHKWF